jgi:hypothetical protein
MTKTPRDRTSPTTPRTRKSRGAIGRWLATCRRRRAESHREPVDVVSQFQAARRQPWAAGLAGIVGGLPPFIGQAMAHAEVGADGSWWHDPKAIAVAGCMLFSMSTMYLFGRATFRDVKKAVGFVAAMELAMVASGLWYVRLATLAVVVAVNMVTTGAGIALAYESAQRRREADAQRARTRAQTRAEQRAARRGAPGPTSIPIPAPVSTPASTSWSASASAPAALARRPRVTLARRGGPIDVSAVEYDDARLS